MASLRGDAHKFYIKLKNSLERRQSISDLNELTEIDEIQQFYRKLHTSELTKIRYRIMKEQKGNGMIPLLVTSLPWLAFIISDELHYLFKKMTVLLFLFLICYPFLIIFSSTIHYREKAWAAVHIEIINDILKERKEKNG